MEAYNLTDIEILVIEHNPFMQRLLTGILREFQFRKIQMATDSEEAIHYFQHYTVDMIFSNWGPNSDEAIVLKKIRDIKESVNPYVPIIIFSTFSEEKYVKLARDLGMNEYLALPISPGSIYRHICNIIENPRAFVESEHFLGPDRRRSKFEYNGEERRKDEPDPEEGNEALSK